jgi:hypothetical protein
MIRGGFLSEEDRKAPIALARDGLAAGRVRRRATALVRSMWGCVQADRRRDRRANPRSVGQAANLR